MSATVLLKNLLNKLGKRDEIQGLPSNKVYYNDNKIILKSRF